MEAALTAGRLSPEGLSALSFAGIARYLLVVGVNGAVKLLQQVSQESRLMAVDKLTPRHGRGTRACRRPRPS